MMQSATMTSTTSVTVNQKSMILSFSDPPSAAGCGANRDEIIGDQRSSPDEAAVDIGHREQLARISGLHAAAVQDRQPRRRLIAPGDERADESMRALSLLRRRSPAGADRPDRLIRERRSREPRNAPCVEHGPKLALYHRFGLAPRALLKGLADAQNRRQAGPPRGHELGCDPAVILAVEAAPLGVADDHVAAAELLQHRARHFACVRAGFLLREILRAPGDPASGERRGDLRQ